MKKENEVLRFPPLTLWPDSAMAIPISADPLGSYTGRPSDPCETPVQDADDL